MLKKQRIKRSGTLTVLIFSGLFLLYILLQVTSWMKSYSQSEFWSFMDTTIKVVLSLTIIATVIIVILENKDPVKTTAWLLVLILLPGIGAIFYIFLGRNFRKEKLFSRKELEDKEKLERLRAEQIKGLSSHEWLSDPKVRSKLKTMTLLLNNSKALLTRNNQIRLMTSGEDVFRDIFQELENAKHHIHLEFYIIQQDETGQELRDILVRKAKEGVEVRVIFDDVGSWDLSKDYLNSLNEAGVKVVPFLPVRFPLLASKLNYRNHRKIIVVDGKTAYTGGMNIANRYRKGDPVLGDWRDLHLKMTGDSVHSLQAVFLTDWYFGSGETLEGEVYFPDPGWIGEQLAQVVTSGPDSEYASIMQAFFSAIANAKEYVYIVNPYFIPNESIYTAMKTAAMSGVDVRLVIPGVTDSKVTKFAANTFLDGLMDAGVKVYTYRDGFIHSKALVVDGIFSTVGSANMDYRSFEQNFEVNALIYDEEFSKSLKEVIMEDMEHSDLLVQEEFEKRPWGMKFQESFVRLFAPIL